MSKQSPVLVIDDDKDLLRATGQTLELAGFAVSLFTSAQDALPRLNEPFEGVVVSDIRMPGLDGLAMFRRIREIDEEIPVVLMTGHGDIAMAVKAIKDGVYDFIAKPFAAERLVQCVERAAEKRSLVIENRRLKAAHDSELQLPFIGQTPVMERLRGMVRQIAATEVDVLLTGETGTGKEVVASLLHGWSRRSRSNFVALNCGALPEQIIESELFGHEPGAFTGAQKKRVGRIEYSSGGTLFLDEIESMPLATQVQMLRVLEMREVTPLGTNEIRPVDLRVIAASKVDLGDPGQRPRFREDLYYRLNVVTLAIPPLRERRGDVPLLFNFFTQKAAQRFEREVPDPTTSVRRHLREHEWPGNVRELSHYAERFVLGLEGAGPVDQAGPDPSAPLFLRDRMERYEADIIRETLAIHAGDVQQTIAALGMPRKTFYDKLQRHGIVRSSYSDKR
jgi:two-component system C4-dicarboxylate transport response regulator DctD